MGRGRRSAPGRRSGVGADSGAGGADDDDEETGTSVDDLTSEADPGTFDTTFTDADADLSIQGRFDPTAGPKQVIPRLAYVLNYNLVYNPDRDRWEPDTGNRDAGGAGVSIVGVAEETVGSGNFLFVGTDISDRTFGGDTFDVGITYADGTNPNDTAIVEAENPDDIANDVGYTILYEDQFGGWTVGLFNGNDTSIRLQVVVYRIEVPDDAPALRTF